MSRILAVYLCSGANNAVQRAEAGYEDFPVSMATITGSGAIDRIQAYVASDVPETLKIGDLHFGNRYVIDSQNAYFGWSIIETPVDFGSNLQTVSTGNLAYPLPSHFRVRGEWAEEVQLTSGPPLVTFLLSNLEPFQVGSFVELQEMPLYPQRLARLVMLFFDSSGNPAPYRGTVGWKTHYIQEGIGSCSGQAGASSLQQYAVMRQVTDYERILDFAEARFSCEIDTITPDMPDLPEGPPEAGIIPPAPIGPPRPPLVTPVTPVRPEPYVPPEPIVQGGVTGPVVPEPVEGCECGPWFEYIGKCILAAGQGIVDQIYYNGLYLGSVIEAEGEVLRGEIEFLTDSIVAVGSDIETDLQEIDMDLCDIRDVLEEIRDLLPVEVTVERGCGQQVITGDKRVDYGDLYDDSI